MYPFPSRNKRSADVCKKNLPSVYCGLWLLQNMPYPVDSCVPNCFDPTEKANACIFTDQFLKRTLFKSTCLSRRCLKKIFRYELFLDWLKVDIFQNYCTSSSAYFLEQTLPFSLMQITKTQPFLLNYLFQCNMLHHHRVIVCGLSSSPFEIGLHSIAREHCTANKIPLCSLSVS